MVSVFSSNENASLERKTDVGENVVRKITEIWDENQLKKCVKWIRENEFQKICVQFPDDALNFSIEITEKIQKEVDGKVFVLGDTSYGSCCVDEIAASHVNADAIIHFGHACLSKSVRLPILYVFYMYDLDVDSFFTLFQEKFKDPNEKIGIFYDVGYSHAIEKITGKLNMYTNVEIGKLADTREEPDVLCWKMINETMENYSCVYIGRDNQSFFNITMGIQCLKWNLYEPGQNTMKEMTAMDSKWIRRRYFYVEKCKDAQSIGIVVATLTSKGYLDIVKHIQEIAKKRGVRTYILSVGKINPSKLANFMEIDCFVLVGCPENDLFNSRDFFKPLVSVFEFEMAFNPAWKNQLPDSYSTDFKEILPNGRLHKHFNDDEMEENDISLVTGRVRNVGARKDNLQSTGCQELQLKSNNEIAEITSADTFQARSWQGLEQNLGKTEPAAIQEGRQGIPMKYTDDPMEL